MSGEIPEEMFRKHITTEDLSGFKWRILKYMCSVFGIYDTFPETLLFHRTDFKRISILNSAKSISMAKEGLFTSSLWIM